MDGFDHILNWKLQPGSHPFPGKDGGTCINEAAIVAAGFEYQPVRRVEDMPDCFSRPICKLAMQLNDYASDAERQRLLPFVTRLACADTPAIELERAAYIKSKRRDRSLVRIRSKGARRCPGNRMAGRHAWRRRGEDPAGEGSVTCVQRRFCSGQPDLREGQELVRAEEADRACVSDVRLAASSEWMRAHRLVRRQ